MSSVWNSGSLPFPERGSASGNYSKALIDDSASSRIRNIHNEKDLKKVELQGEQITISDEQLIKAIERAVKAMQGASTSLNFSVHEKTKQIMVKIIDNNSGEIIRELPPEKNLDFLVKVWEMAGILVDERR